MNRNVRRFLGVAALGLGLTLTACGGNSASSVAANHPSAAAGASSAAAAASNYANSPAVKGAEATTENAALHCEQVTHADPVTTAGRTKIGDCMAPAAVLASFRTCRSDALNGVHVGMAHPIATVVNAWTACYIAVVLHQPVPQGLTLPAGFAAPTSSASSTSSPQPSTTGTK